MTDTTETVEATETATAVATEATTTETTTATETAPAETVAEVTYALTLPEGSLLDPAFLERTAADARTQGLTNEQAQAVVNLASQEAGKALDAKLAAFQPGGAEHAKLVDGWKAETLADTALGATEAERLAAIQKGHLVLEKFKQQQPEHAAELVQFLETSGYGNHRAVARMFAWLGKAMDETPVVTGPPSGGKPAKSLAELMYPSMYDKQT